VQTERAALLSERRRCEMSAMITTTTFGLLRQRERERERQTDRQRDSNATTVKLSDFSARSDIKAYSSCIEKQCST